MKRLGCQDGYGFKGMIAVAIVCLLFVLASCSLMRSEKPAQTHLKITLDAKAIINSSSEVQSAPLQLRIYELNDPGLFEQADFLDLYNNDAAMLQSSLIKRHYLPTVWPGSIRTFDLTLDPDTSSIAVLAEFNDYFCAVSKAIQVINRGELNALILHIEENRLRFSKYQ